MEMKEYYDGRSILLVGGSGTLGIAFMKKAMAEEWNCRITVYSRDWKKHYDLRKIFPDTTFIIGDVLNYEMLKMAVAGHDLVIHMAAMKAVPEGEKNPLAVFDTNVAGSQNVLAVCTELEVESIFISTDKCVTPVNSYGASKMMMERMVQQYAAGNPHLKYHLVRYGNVFGSSGSFVHNWLYDMQNLGFVNSTSDEMTRFWLTTDDALELIALSLNEPSGHTLIPQARAAKMGDIEDWLIPEGIEIIHHGLRPGEKRHECMLSMEEGFFAERIELEGKKFFRLHPAWDRFQNIGLPPYNSYAKNIRMGKEEFLKLSGMTGEELYADDHS